MIIWLPIIISVLILSGSIIHMASKTDNSVPEQIIETVLKAEGINIDFSDLNTTPIEPAAGQKPLDVPD
jgi:predicted nucleic-acid-binding protein